MKLYFSATDIESQQVLIALYEKQVSFELMIINLDSKADQTLLSNITPYASLPVLDASTMDNSAVIHGSQAILEFLESTLHQYTKLIPPNSLEPRFALRKHYLENERFLLRPLQIIKQQMQLPLPKQDQPLIRAQHQFIDTRFKVLDKHLEQNFWLFGDRFTMLDCAFIPILAQAYTSHPFLEYTYLHRYWQRAHSRGSYQLTIHRCNHFNDNLAPSEVISQQGMEL